MNAEYSARIAERYGFGGNFFTLSNCFFDWLVTVFCIFDGDLAERSPGKLIVGAMKCWTLLD
jgi:hypothetical protein